jgi:hypothetical protein
MKTGPEIAFDIRRLMGYKKPKPGGGKWDGGEG